MCFNVVVIVMHITIPPSHFKHLPFFDKLSAGELWATSVPKRSQIGAPQWQRQSQQINQPLSSRFGHAISFSTVLYPQKIVLENWKIDRVEVQPYLSSAAPLAPR